MFQIRDGAERDRHRALLGEFYRVGRQIEHDCTERVPSQADAGGSVIEVDIEREMLLMVGGFERGHDLGNQVGKLNLVVEIGFGTRRGKGKIQNIFNGLREVMSAHVEALYNLARRGAELVSQVITQDIEIAKENLRGGAQLVREVRERLELNSVVPAPRSCCRTAALSASFGLQRPDWWKICHVPPFRSLLAYSSEL